jgi:dye decolorizing peroxidase
VSRRTALRAALIAAGGAAVGYGVSRIPSAGTGDSSAGDNSAGDGGSRDGAEPQPAALAAADAGAGAFGTDAVPFRGLHQAGVVTAGQAHALFCAFDAHPNLDRDAAIRLMRVLTDDIDRLTRGGAALGDTAPELALRPARLTITVGFGPRMFALIGRPDARPAGLVDLPGFASIDQLDQRYCGGDLLLRIGGDDPTVVSHAQRMLLKDTRAFAAPRWFQRGFLRARGIDAPDVTPRNLMGQVDGTVNPSTAEEQDRLVWSADPGWFANGTTAVIRRLKMDLDRWDTLDRAAMETVIGRRLSNGAPLSGQAEFDEPDFNAVDDTGLPAIASSAHIRLARGSGAAPQILRRGYSYDDSPDANGASDLGLIFCAFQADIGTQFIPMQQRLADADLLNTWITPVGSAVFAILPGAQVGEYLGEALLR